MPRHAVSRVTVTLSLLLLSVLALSPLASCQDFDLEVEHAILLDGETGQVLFEKNVDTPRPPASLVKLMTTLLAVEAIEAGAISLDDEVHISARASSTTGSRIYLSRGEVVSVETLLTAIAVPSANDACVALAEHIAGTEEAFVSLMNERARQLGLDNTRFMNSSGLPAPGEASDTQRMSARDAAIISRELVQYPKVTEWSAKTHMTFRDGIRSNTNDLVRRYPGVDGLKTGWTSESLYSLAATAERDGMRLVTVVMGAETNEERIQETIKLLNYGFGRFERSLLVREGETLGRIELEDGTPEVVEIRASEDLYALVNRLRLDHISREVEFEEGLRPPFAEGDTIGTIVVHQDGNYLGEASVVVTENVRRANILVVLFRRFRDYLMSLVGLS